MYDSRKKEGNSSSSSSSNSSLRKNGKGENQQFFFPFSYGSGSPAKREATTPLASSFQSEISLASSCARAGPGGGGGRRRRKRRSFSLRWLVSQVLTGAAGHRYTPPPPPPDVVVLQIVCVCVSTYQASNQLTYLRFSSSLFCCDFFLVMMIFYTCLPADVLLPHCVHTIEA